MAKRITSIRKGSCSQIYYLILSTKQKDRNSLSDCAALPVFVKISTMKTFIFSLFLNLIGIAPVICISIPLKTETTPKSGLLTAPNVYACAAHSDCIVRDMGSCCTSIPTCVNKDVRASGGTCPPDTFSVREHIRILHCRSIY
jgi:hypothetical protein